jgi:hypothetical protein
MIDKIISFGDSFMYGSDLSDCDGSETSQFSQLTWPALCAKELGINYRSYSLGGKGNRFIAFTILKYAKKNALNVINWSWINRKEIFTVQGDRPNSISIHLDNDESKLYYKHFQTDYNDQLENLHIIHSTLCYLKSKGFLFISTYLDNLLFTDIKPQVYFPVNQTLLRDKDKDKDIWHNKKDYAGGNTYARELMGQIEQDMQLFPNNQTFLEWSRSNGYPESDNWHPLEQAHQEAAKIWLPIYKEAINTHITNSED